MKFNKEQPIGSTNLLSKKFLFSKYDDILKQTCLRIVLVVLIGISVTSAYKMIISEELKKLEQEVALTSKVQLELEEAQMENQGLTLKLESERDRQMTFKQPKVLRNEGYVVQELFHFLSQDIPKDIQLLSIKAEGSEDLIEFPKQPDLNPEEALNKDTPHSSSQENTEEIPPLTINESEQSSSISEYPTNVVENILQYSKDIGGEKLTLRACANSLESVSKFIKSFEAKSELIDNYSIVGIQNVTALTQDKVIVFEIKVTLTGGQNEI